VRLFQFLYAEDVCGWRMTCAHTCEHSLKGHCVRRSLLAVNRTCEDRFVLNKSIDFQWLKCLLKCIVSVQNWSTSVVKFTHELCIKSFCLLQIYFIYLFLYQSNFSFTYCVEIRQRGVQYGVTLIIVLIIHIKS